MDIVVKAFVGHESGEGKEDSEGRTVFDGNLVISEETRVVVFDDSLVNLRRGQCREGSCRVYRWFVPLLVCLRIKTVKVARCLTVAWTYPIRDSEEASVVKAVAGYVVRLSI